MSHPHSLCPQPSLCLRFCELKLLPLSCGTLMWKYLSEATSSRRSDNAVAQIFFQPNSFPPIFWVKLLGKFLKNYKFLRSWIRYLVCLLRTLANMSKPKRTPVVSSKGLGFANIERKRFCKYQSIGRWRYWTRPPKVVQKGVQKKRRRLKEPCVEDCTLA